MCRPDRMHPDPAQGMRHIKIFHAN
jgi:hypothetical protein